MDTPPTMDIDPYHICHHRSGMNQASLPHNNLSIRRHAVQQLLRQALDSAPQPVYGLLGGHGQSVETALALHGSISSQAICDSVQAWQDRGIRLIATYSSEETPPFALQPELMPESIQTALPSLPRLIISTDTKGRIEAKLLVLEADGNTHPCALEMQEDGGLYPLGDKG